MRLSDRLLNVWTYGAGLGLPLVGAAAYLLEWPAGVQLALAPLMIAVVYGTSFVGRGSPR